jgi:outer membrane protein assembly factor BamB
MTFQPIIKRIASIFRTATNRLPGVEGNILVYIVMVMLIFGVLGVTMVTLFSTSITATAEPSESRRALYLYESGVRYGMSELRNNGFTDATINTLNRTTYNMPPSGRFEVNVFSPWFESASSQSVDPSGSVQLNIAHGKVPDGFLGKIPTSAPFLRVVNNDYFSTSASGPQETAKAVVSGRSLVDSDTVRLDLLDDFIVGPRESVCFSVHPFSGGQMIVPIGSLDLNPVARNIFPKRDGAIRVRNCEYFFTEARDMGDRVRLLTLTTNQTICNAPMTIAADEEIIFSSRNYNLTALGRSGNVTYGGDMEHSIGITSHSGRMPGDSRPDIDFRDEANLESVLSQVEPGGNTGFITVDNTNKRLTIGDGSGYLGAIWFNDTRNIGSVKNFCTNGACRFNDGFRAFFTIEYTGTGDGLVFALMNGNVSKNNSSSIGGEKDYTELLGYAGDGRLDAAGTSYPTYPIGTPLPPQHGIIPPKIGLEFDTKVNINSTFEQTVQYCTPSTSAGTLSTDTRNDPKPFNHDRDAIQYIFWGGSSLEIPCRGNNALYDDNRHDATGSPTSNWVLSTGGSVESSPAVSPDGRTIYVGSWDGRLHAFESIGTQKWTSADLFGRVYSPTISSDGTKLYVGTSDGYFYAIRSSDGTIALQYVTGASIMSKPAIGDGGVIYFKSANGYVYANHITDFTNKWVFYVGTDSTDSLSSPVLSPSPAVSNSGNLVYAAAAGIVYAIHAGTGAEAWRYPSSGTIGSSFSSPTVGSDGTVYIGSDNGRLYALNGTTGNKKWDFLPSNSPEAMLSTPNVSTDGSTVYAGNYNDYLYAVKTADGQEKWRYKANGSIVSSPAVDSSNSIYFGSDRVVGKPNVYAIYDRGTTYGEKWVFSTGGDIRGRPAVTGDGTVYVGSFDWGLYAINQFSDPKNIKDKWIAYDSSTVKVGGIPVTVDGPDADHWLRRASSKGPWAIRMEIERSQTPVVDSDGNQRYKYDLRTWVRQQCNLADSGCVDISGTFYADTRVKYSPTLNPPHMVQTIYLLLGDHQDFEKFLFGFTTQRASSDNQSFIIDKFNLSFIRPMDPTITIDPDWN